MTKLWKAEFPVTSFGKRFLLPTKAIPKALMPIVDAFVQSWFQGRHVLSPNLAGRQSGRT